MPQVLYQAHIPQESIPLLPRNFIILFKTEFPFTFFEHVRPKGHFSWGSTVGLVQVDENIKRPSLDAQANINIKRKSLDSQVNENIKRKSLDWHVNENIRSPPLESQVDENIKRSPNPIKLKESSPPIGEIKVRSQSTGTNPRPLADPTRKHT